ncbi:NAD(P)H-dependent flavin oxidoreductase [Luteibaculum oceani]|uniref:Nitronate monooxygenase n=1 Tax=Luteibaculum oceani TaxID=1294296 RepID=A0A5C6V9H5_9FLAO|nr:nitronate monooxygenase [Luteibaculum oceani]TXC81390.1 nitronate monooxygenase [Luteibaculum oceani]
MENLHQSISGTKYPIIQAGMVWVSGWKLALACSKAGILGCIGAGSMSPEVLDIHLTKIKTAIGDLPFAVNLPLFYSKIEEQVQLIIKHRVPIVICSAGSPKKFTSIFKENGIKVFHVVPSLQLALKAQDAEVDAVIAEGFEAGGHNGRDETTSLVLLQELQGNLDIPYFAAGGFGTGRSLLAAQVLGASGVQMGSVFVPTIEASCHPNYKNYLCNLPSGATKLSLKPLNPVRLAPNKFFEEVQKLEQRGASKEDLATLLGKGRAKLGMFDGNLEEGELEIGQIISLVKDVLPAGEVVKRIVREYQEAKELVRRG